MQFEVKRVGSSNSHHKPQTIRMWKHSCRAVSSKKIFKDLVTFYNSSHANNYSSTQLKTRIRSKRTVQQIMQTSTTHLQRLKISSTSWCLYDQITGKHIGFRQKNQREIASLTKIMTAILGIQFFQKCQINPELYIKVTESASKMIGTTANLKTQSWIKFKDLFYGAMLPSGNDAAYLLSQVIGHLLQFETKSAQYLKNIKFLDITKENRTFYTVDFVKLMNKKAEQIGLKWTKFSNPHGLQNALNISCPRDLIILSAYASRNKLFRKIMNTQSYKYQYIELINDQAEQFQELRKSYQKARSNKQKIKITKNIWNNTNILLNKGWEGVKTGQTESAGSCLASLKNNIFIVVLNCKDNDARFYESQKLYNWYLSNKKSQSTDDQDNNTLFSQFK